MIKKFGSIEKMERDFVLTHRLSHKQSLHLFEAMWKEAVLFGVFPPEEPSEGLEVDARIARVLNSCLKESSPA